jgi:hypothetical protein
MSRDVDVPADGWNGGRTTWRTFWIDRARATVLTVSFWVKEAVFVIAGIVILHAMREPQAIRVPFMFLGVG